MGLEALQKGNYILQPVIPHFRGFHSTELIEKAIYELYSLEQC